MWSSEDEAQRAARFHFAVDRDHFIAAHGCLRDIPARYLPIEPGQLSFSNGAYGKPFLSGVSAEGGLEFNLSHSRDFALVAVTRNHPVGVDVEYVRRDIPREKIARRFFSEHELSDLLSLPLTRRETGFFNCWTRKEAEH